MECFVIIVNGFQPLTIITKRSILDVAAVLDPPLNAGKELIEQMMNCYTNNGRERLNLGLEYDELDGYKKFTLSKLLTIITEEFIPKLYRNYLTMNARFTSKHKKYLGNIQPFLKDRPRALVTDILEKLSRVTDEVRYSVEESNNNAFMVKYASDNTNPGGIYLFKVNSRNTRTRCETCSRLTIKSLYC